MIVALALLAAAADPQLSSAFRAAFGKSNSVVLKRQGQMEETVRYTPGALVQAPFGPVLLSVGKVLEPAHASSGKLAAIYLKRGPRGFRVVKRFVPATESGSFGTIEGSCFAKWGRQKTRYSPLFEKSRLFSMLISLP